MVQCTAADHQQTARKGDKPGLKPQRAGEDHSKDIGKEDKDRRFVLKRSQGFALPTLSGARTRKSRHRLLGSNPGPHKDGPEREHQQHRRLADKVVGGGDGLGKTVSIQKALGLAGLLDGRSKGQQAKAADTNHHGGEDHPGTAGPGSLAQGHQQRTDDCKGRHRAGDQIGKQNGQHDIGGICFLKRTAADPNHAVAHPLHKAGALKPGRHQEHPRHQDGIGVGETRQGRRRIHTAGEIERRKRYHRSNPHGDSIQDIAEQGQTKDDNAADQFYVHDQTSFHCKIEDRGCNL